MTKMFLVSDIRVQVVCEHCLKVADFPNQVPLHADSVEPYKQTCHVCDEVLAVPRTPEWPELFTKPGLGGTSINL